MASSDYQTWQALALSGAAAVASGVRPWWLLLAAVIGERVRLSAGKDEDADKRSESGVARQMVSMVVISLTKMIWGSVET